MFEIFSKRQKNQLNAEPFRYDVLPEPLKVQIIYCWNSIIDSFPQVYFHGRDAVYSIIAQNICKELGRPGLTGDARTAQEDVCNYFLLEKNVSHCLDTIEIVFATVIQIVKSDSHTLYGCMDNARNAAAEINARFKEHAIGYELQNWRLVRIDSGFLHNEAVAPAMILLQDQAFSGANEEFLKAHEHFRHGRFAESINECLKSFESTMKTICHKHQWQYNQNDTAKKLLEICERNGLFPVYMSSSLGGLRSVLENVATVRNKLSGHGQGVQQVQITEEISAFVIHSTAANVVLLTSLEKLLP